MRLITRRGLYNFVIIFEPDVVLLHVKFAVHEKFVP